MPSRKLAIVPPVVDSHLDAPDLRDAVHAVVAELTLTPADGPLVALVQRYAKEIELSVALTAEAEELSAKAALEGDFFLARDVATLRAKVERGEVVAKIGPLLNRALSDLLAAPAARAKAAGGKPSPAAAGRLAQLRTGTDGQGFA
jgi:hypothetical protein